MAYRLDLDRKVFYSTLKPYFRTFKPSELFVIQLAYTEGRLRILTCEGYCFIPATGTWPADGVYLRSVRNFLSAVKHLPKTDRLTLQYIDDRLFIAKCPLECKRDPTLPPLRPRKKKVQPYEAAGFPDNTSYLLSLMRQASGSKHVEAQCRKDPTHA